jgi:hypothetical protein
MLDAAWFPAILHYSLHAKAFAKDRQNEEVGAECFRWL